MGPTSSPRVVRLATRGSPLARWQTEHVAGLIRGRHPEVAVEPVVVKTEGDRRQDAPIWQIGGKGLFVREIQAAVLHGRADAAVHSAKDMPGEQLDGLLLAAIAVRADASDVLVGGRLAELRPGARVGTGAPRRRAQLAHLRPDLTFAELRGNIGTRLDVASDHPIVMASAALDRLGVDPTERGLDVDVLDHADLLPQVGQGAIAVESRADADGMIDLLAAVDHEPSRRAVVAERAFLAELGGDCDLPCGAHATVQNDGTLRLEAMLASLDGRVLVRHTGTGPDPDALGHTVGRALLEEAGGSALLAVGR
ncbi:MAG: hydroxymethylbilane synthase [Acidimicrobiales bacterium]